MTHPERGIGSAHRLYFRLDRDWGHFDICAAPFGTGYFFSFRYIVPTVVGFWIKIFAGVFVIAPVIAGLTLLGFLTAGLALVLLPVVSLLWAVIVYTWRKETYYKQDTALMYLSTVPQIIKTLFERVTLQKGVRLEDRVTAGTSNP